MPLDLSKMKEESTDIPAELDFGFQHLIQQREMGVTKSATASTKENEVAVIALVSSFEAWKAIPEVKDPEFIVKDPEGEMVMGNLDVRDLEKVHALEEVLEIEPSRSVYSDLHIACQETESTPDQLPKDTASNGGEGVLVGIVDYGFDLAHPNFRNADGSTRVIEIWDQLGERGLSAPSGYGQAFKSDEINAALSSQNAFTALGYDLFKGNNPADGTHGTHVADIAAGNGLGTGAPGVAPKADLMFVDAANRLGRMGTVEALEGFPETKSLIQAVRYIFERGYGRPTVINISLGSHAGSHDGKSLVERSLDNLMDAEPNRAIVISAGNSYEEDHHKTCQIEPGKPVDLQWLIPAEVPPVIPEVHIWYPRKARMQLELFAPNGQLLGTVGPADNKRCTIGYTLGAFLANRTNLEWGRDNAIGAQLYPQMPPGAYTLRLTLLTDEAITFDAWIEREDRFRTKFAPPVNRDMTLGSLCTGRLSIAVGAYNAAVEGTPIGAFSSSGPTRDGRHKPEVSAPGDGVFAAHAGQPNGRIGKSGTSMSAPHVTGIVALIFAEASAQDKDLTIHEIREILIKTARKNPPAGDGWDPRYGYGRVSTKAALEETKALLETIAPRGALEPF